MCQDHVTSLTGRFGIIKRMADHCSVEGAVAKSKLISFEAISPITDTTMACLCLATTQ